MSSRSKLLLILLCLLGITFGLDLGHAWGTVRIPSDLPLVRAQSPAQAAPHADYDAREVHLPSLGPKGWGADSCSSTIHAQVLGATVAVKGSIPVGPTTRLLLVQFGADGSCPSGSPEPLKVDCSGFIVPGSSWTLQTQLDPDARSAALFSLAIDALPPGRGSNPGCQDIAAALTGQPGSYLRFLEAYRSGSDFPGLEPGWKKGGAIAATVERGCGPAGAKVDAVASSDYGGVSADRALAGLQGDGTYAAWFAGLAGGVDSSGRSLTELSIQNLGLTCATVQVFIHVPGRPAGDDQPSPPDDCRQPRLCATVSVSPGAAARLPLADCAAEPGTVGVSLHGTEMMAVVADSHDGRVLASTAAEPRARTRWSGLLPALPAGWRPVVQVLNPHPDLRAKVKVYLLDRGGDVITSLAGWICPQATGSFSIPAPSGLEQRWTGRVRVESQEWWTPATSTLGNTVPVVASIDLLPPATMGVASGSVSALGLELEPLDEAGPDVTVLALPRIGKKTKLALAARAEDGVFAVANLAQAPGYTDFTLYIYDVNGLLDFTCNKLAQQGLEYVDLSTWGYVNPGFTGSAVISAGYWEHLAYDDQGRLTGNRAHLAAWQLRHSPDDDPGRWQGAKAQAMEGVAAASASEWLGLLPHCPRSGPVIRVPTPTSTAGTPAASSATPTPPDGTPSATEPSVTRTAEAPTPTVAPTATQALDGSLWLPWVNGEG